VHQVHTILFDFDDTLFLTTDAQVKAWIEAIDVSLQDGVFTVTDLTPDVRRHVEKGLDLKDLMTALFLKQQQEEDILRHIFKTMLHPRKLENFKRQRSRAREKWTESLAVPIPNIIRDAEELSQDHQLVIVSATSEKLVRKILVKHKLVNVFPIVIGRDVPRAPWQSVEGKTQQFIRVSNMLGVPLERMVFVGDSNSDYRSARQLGLRFIESRYNAELFHVKSLVSSDEAVDHPFLLGEEQGELIAAIKKIESAAKSRLSVCPERY
jgi:phosphoglycolate phosphatase-like HAD superfamily hydrolase